MRIGRKEAILALVATMIPWMSRKGSAQRTTVRTLSTQSTDLTDLQARVLALETQLASQVAFTKDLNGDLRLRAPGNLRIDTGLNYTVWAGSQMDLRASGATSVKGATIALN